MESVLSEKPATSSIANVPTRLIGMASTGTIAARQLWRKIITTITTRISASNRVLATSCSDWPMNSVGL